MMINKHNNIKKILIFCMLTLGLYSINGEIYKLDSKEGKDENINIVKIFIADVKEIDSVFCKASDSHVPTIDEKIVLVSLKAIIDIYVEKYFLPKGQFYNTKYFNTRDQEDYISSKKILSEVSRSLMTSKKCNANKSTKDIYIDVSKMYFIFLGSYLPNYDDMPSSILKTDLKKYLEDVMKDIKYMDKNITGAKSNLQNLKKDINSTEEDLVKLSDTLKSTSGDMNKSYIDDTLKKVQSFNDSMHKKETKEAIENINNAETKLQSILSESNQSKILDLCKIQDENKMKVSLYVPILFGGLNTITDIKNDSQGKCEFIGCYGGMEINYTLDNNVILGSLIYVYYYNIKHNLESNSTFSDDNHKYRETRDAYGVSFNVGYKNPLQKLFNIKKIFTLPTPENLVFFNVLINEDLKFYPSLKFQVNFVNKIGFGFKTYLYSDYSNFNYLNKLNNHLYVSVIF